MKIAIGRVAILALLLLAVTAGCASYERKVVPFRMPDTYPNVTEVAGVKLAAHAISDPEEAKDAFGFDIIEAGVLPLQLAFDNKGNNSFTVVPNQTFLIDAGNNLWPIIDSGLAYDRISKKTELGRVAPEAVKSGALTAAAGALIGAAIGIVSGGPVADAAVKGAAVGTAIGATTGGARGLGDREVGASIREDLKNRSLQNRSIKPGDLAFGFIFFPAEAKKPKELRLRLRDEASGKIFNLVFAL